MNDPEMVVTRRDFVRGTVSAVMAASVPGTSWAQAGSRIPRSSSVILVRDQKVLNPSLVVDRTVLKQMLSDCVLQVSQKEN